MATRTRNYDPAIRARASAALRQLKPLERRNSLSPSQFQELRDARAVLHWRSTENQKRRFSGGTASSASGSSSKDSKSSSSPEPRGGAGKNVRTSTGIKVSVDPKRGLVNDAYKERNDFFGDRELLTEKSASRLNEFLSSGWTTRAPKNGNYLTQAINVTAEVRQPRGLSNKGVRAFSPYEGTENEDSQITIYKRAQQRAAGSGVSSASSRSSGSSRSSSRSSGSSGGSGSSKQPKAERYLTPNGKPNGGSWVKNSPYTEPTYDGGVYNGGAPGLSGAGAYTRRGSNTSVSSSTDVGPAPNTEWLADIGNPAAANNGLSNTFTPPVAKSPSPPEKEERNSFNDVLNFLESYGNIYSQGA